MVICYCRQGRQRETWRLYTGPANAGAALAELAEQGYRNPHHIGSVWELDNSRGGFATLYTRPSRAIPAAMHLAWTDLQLGGYEHAISKAGRIVLRIRAQSPAAALRIARAAGIGGLIHVGN